MERRRDGGGRDGRGGIERRRREGWRREGRAERQTRCLSLLLGFPSLSLARPPARPLGQGARPGAPPDTSPSAQARAGALRSPSGRRRKRPGGTPGLSRQDRPRAPLRPPSGGGCRCRRGSRCAHGRGPRSLLGLIKSNHRAPPQPRSPPAPPGPPGLRGSAPAPGRGAPRQGSQAARPGAGGARGGTGEERGGCGPVRRGSGAGSGGSGAVRRRGERHRPRSRGRREPLASRPGHRREPSGTVGRRRGPAGAGGASPSPRSDARSRRGGRAPAAITGVHGVGAGAVERAGDGRRRSGGIEGRRRGHPRGPARPGLAAGPHRC